MSNPNLELVKRALENALILMDDVQKPLNATDKALLRQIKDYSITILCTVNKLL